MSAPVTEGTEKPVSCPTRSIQVGRDVPQGSELEKGEAAPAGVECITQPGSTHQKREGASRSMILLIIATAVGGWPLLFGVIMPW